MFISMFILIDTFLLVRIAFVLVRIALRLDIFNRGGRLLLRCVKQPSRGRHFGGNLKSILFCHFPFKVSNQRVVRFFFGFFKINFAYTI